MIGERWHDTYGPPPASSRRMATYELAVRGIHYLVLNDTDFSAKDILEDPDAWGLKIVSEVAGAKLYKSIWPAVPTTPVAPTPSSSDATSETKP
jgi:hypothetical protein